jgi:ariadne-1
VDHGQTTGGFYRCNRYDAGKPPEGSTEKQRAKLELDRYLHYYQRFHGHDSALKFAAGQREQAERKMVERQEAHRSTWIDVQFLKHAAEQVIDCRRVLKYTYVLGYFLEDASPEKQLFEHHQELLEKNTEKLHEYTEQALDAIDRTQVVNLTRVTERFMASLLASMAGGVVNLAAGVASEST